MVTDPNDLPGAASQAEAEASAGTSALPVGTIELVAPAQASSPPTEEEHARPSALATAYPVGVDQQEPALRAERRRRRRGRRGAREAGKANQIAETAATEASAPGEHCVRAKRGERLHKVLAQQGLGSRRKMEALIASGEVEVNGEPAHLGQIVNERDRVFVKGRRVKIAIGDRQPRVLIYHKPPGEIVSRDDPEGRPSVFDRLPRPDHGKWVPVGRLDFNSEGLLLFTTYGELANRLMHPRYEVSREYSVRVFGELTHEQEDQLIDGIELEDGVARVTSLERIDADSDGANHWYKLTLQEGRNREVRRMFEHLGLTVSRLIRTRYGPVQLPSWLKRGQWKLLDEAETFALLEAVGLRSRKKLEKAARFGGARGKLPLAPVGPMRTATEHAELWLKQANGGGAWRFQDPYESRFGVDGRPHALEQQQFPGFGGMGADFAPAAIARSRRKRQGASPSALAGGPDQRGEATPRAARRKRRGARGKTPGATSRAGSAPDSATAPSEGQRSRRARRGRRRRGARAVEAAGVTHPVETGQKHSGGDQIEGQSGAEQTLLP
ncbi:MAG: rRNA pseudouridine synthase [Casimicrobiaceae bacterium]|nr:rRNA pseudouridine synthase [Casimicrobiaceae bacterium]MDW8312029.1 pseudouridine synthase [Burkholderiales bacterium]